MLSASLPHTIFVIASQHAIRMRSGVAGLSMTKSADEEQRVEQEEVSGMIFFHQAPNTTRDKQHVPLLHPFCCLHARMASLMAKKTDAASCVGGSPTARLEWTACDVSSEGDGEGVFKDEMQAKRQHEQQKAET